MADPLGPSILFAFFLLCAALVYALICALPSVDQAEMQRQESQGSAYAKRIRRLLHRFSKGYGEIRMTFVALMIASYAFASVCAVPALTTWLHIHAAVSALILLIIFLILAFALVVIIAGSIAVHRPDQALHLTAAPAERLVQLFSPITLAAYWIGKGFLALLKLQPATASETVTEEDILMMVDIGEEKGSIEADEKEMIENIFEFNNMNAEDCMVHRKEITAIDVESSEDEVFKTITESGLSRFPVYEDSIDNIIGILTARDFLINRCSENPKPFRQLTRPAHFVPESVHTDVLFREMQTRKQHMSIVIDEYGGTSGLITLEDLLEEIVGNIYDEFDPKEEQDIVQIGDGRYRVSGSAELETLAEVLGVEFEEDEDYDTLGGLIFSHLPEIPSDGEKPVIMCGRLRISVTAIADRRVEWAIVEKLPDEIVMEEN